MSQAAAPAPVPSDKTFMERMLDGIEKVGNKVPHPVLMFLYLIAFIIVLSAILDLANVAVPETIAEPVPVPTVPKYYEDTTQDQVQDVYEDEGSWEDAGRGRRQVTVTVTETMAETVPVQTVPNCCEDTPQDQFQVVYEDEEYWEDAEFELREVTVSINSLLTVEGIRFIFSTFVTNFQGFGVVAVTF